MKDNRHTGQSGVERIRSRLRKRAFESLYGPFAWAYDWVSRTFFLGQWRIWQRTAIRHLKGKRILEVGMGTGNLQIDLARAGFDAWGVDLSAQMLRQATKKARRLGIPPFNACRAMSQALPFPGGAFDSIVSTFPSEYISDPGTLAELARVLRPGGRLVVVLGGWLHPRGTGGKAMEGVARVVYGYKRTPQEADAEVLEKLARQESGWYNCVSQLSEHMAGAGFTAGAHTASNDKGTCLMVVADLNSVQKQRPG